MMKIYFIDLDGTLIFSHRHFHDGYEPIEVYKGKDISFIENRTYKRLVETIEHNEFVPVTSRTKEQYARINIFQQHKPQYALLDNGGVLLINGDEDIEWTKDTHHILKDSAEGLADIENWASKYGAVKRQDAIILFVKPTDDERRGEIINGLNQYLDFCWFEHGNKLYICSKQLTKGASVERFKKKHGVDRCIGAGDSEVDFSMLDYVDRFVTDERNRAKISFSNTIFVEQRNIALTALNMK